MDRCYRAVASRDARFDGQFILAVRTTGIYCRPSCPAMKPKRRNCEFFADQWHQADWDALLRPSPEVFPSGSDPA